MVARVLVSVSGVGASFDLYPTFCYKVIQVTSKIKVLSSGTLLLTPDLENFATACRSSKRVINFARERWTLQA